VQARKRKPLVSSVAVLRALATGITMLSLGGMTAYATAHLHDSAAPLKPAAATAAPAPAVTTRTTTGRIQLSAGVPTTTARPVTTTHRS
jgi:hypothetical protein